ncbi:hypothetical protein HQ545_03185 [Candidatus Woesearchaeota archaeon]|nr:hypothetical protein [Candidatus Woesearchaeota archaeon]
MDLLLRKRIREKKKEKELKRKLAEEAIFNKPEKVYIPSTKNLTIVAAIMFVGIVLYFIFTAEVMIENRCGLYPGIECKVLILESEGITIEVYNLLKEEMNITLEPEECPVVSKLIQPNTKIQYTFKCSNEDILKKDVKITHIGYSGLPHEKTGFIEGKIE